MSSLVLLQRILSAKDPFILVTDSLLQSAHHLLAEFSYHATGQVLHLSYESASKYSFADHYIDCTGLAPAQVSRQVREIVESRKTLVVVDSLNYLENHQIAEFVAAVSLPKATVVGVYHTDLPQVTTTGVPNALATLRFVAQAIFELLPLEINDHDLLGTLLAKLCFPNSESLNLTKFKATLTHRRKSGRSVNHDFIIDVASHTYDVYKPPKDEDADDDAVLKNLTTFSLTNTAKQKLAREQVELPFMEAQTELGKLGGAIVYEFEKDDDYDEEDPYEDPF